MNSERDSAHAAQAAVGAFALDRYWRCSQCGKLLGELTETGLLIRHGRLLVIAPLPLWRRCERCGMWNDLVNPLSVNGGASGEPNAS